MPPPRVAPGTPLSTNLTCNRNHNLNLLHNLTPHPALARRCTEGGRGHPLSGARETWAAPFAPRKVLHDAASSAPKRKRPDRKSTRLNSSHVRISYAVFCLKKK